MKAEQHVWCIIVSRIPFSCFQWVAVCSRGTAWRRCDLVRLNIFRYYNQPLLIRNYSVMQLALKWNTVINKPALKWMANVASLSGWNHVDYSTGGFFGGFCVEILRIMWGCSRHEVVHFVWALSKINFIVSWILNRCVQWFDVHGTMRRDIFL